VLTYNRTILFFILIFFFTAELTAQFIVQNEILKDTFAVDSIKIIGNENTEDYIILRELTFSVGDSVSFNQLDYNKERIYSLGIFNFVNVSADTTLNKISVVINVTESWYIYPIPFYHLVNDEVRYGIRVVWKNFRGRNEKLSATVAMGYNPYYSMTYQIPVLSKEYNLGMNISSYYQRIVNPSESTKNIIGEDFEYIFISNAVTLGKRINQFNNLAVSVGYSYVEAPKYYDEKVNASKQRIDRYPFMGISYQLDTRDLKQYAMMGTYVNVSYLYKGFGVQDISHSIVFGDFRQFGNLFGSLSHKYRVAAQHTAGNSVPIYDLSYIGYKDFVRGHKSDIREGDNSLVISYELDLPLIKEWDLVMDLPLLPKRLTSARIGIHITAFADAGIAFNTRDRINKLCFDKGWGFGINLLFLPHNGLRFEYAWNEFGQGEFLIGTGLSF